MTVCSGFLPPQISLSIFIIGLCFLVYFLVYRPFKNQKQRSTKIKSIILFIFLLSILMLSTLFSIDTCYYLNNPRIYKDFSVEVTSEQQAKQIFYNLFNEEFKYVKQENLSRFEYLTNFSLSKLVETQDSYSVYYLHTQYILNKNGKLYKRSIGV